MDCGLISLKDRDSYAKRAGRTGIFNSGPSDRDLADQIGSAQVLIGAVVSESGGWGSKGEWIGGGTPPRVLPQRCSAGVGGLGATEGLLACGLVQKEENDTSNPLECTGWLIEVQLCLAVKRGGPGRRRAWPGHLGCATGSSC